MYGRLGQRQWAWWLMIIKSCPWGALTNYAIQMYIFLILPHLKRQLLFVKMPLTFFQIFKYIIKINVLSFNIMWILSKFYTNVFSDMVKNFVEVTKDFSHHLLGFVVCIKVKFRAMYIVVYNFFKIKLCSLLLSCNRFFTCGIFDNYLMWKDYIGL